MVWARAWTLVVFPVPGGPQMITLGMLPSSAITLSRSSVCSFPTTCFRSIHSRVAYTQRDGESTLHEDGSAFAVSSERVMEEGWNEVLAVYRRQQQQWHRN